MFHVSSMDVGHITGTPCFFSTKSVNRTTLGEFGAPGAMTRTQSRQKDLIEIQKQKSPSKTSKYAPNPAPFDPTNPDQLHPSRTKVSRIKHQAPMPSHAPCLTLSKTTPSQLSACISAANSSSASSTSNSSAQLVRVPTAGSTGWRSRSSVGPTCYDGPRSDQFDGH